jgi:ATP-dependent RNA helicase DDX3X
LQKIEVIAESRERPNPIKSVSVVPAGPNVAADISKFDDAGLHPIMRENIRLCNYQVPTPIQAYSIPAIQTHHDLIAIAQTGEFISLYQVHG